MSSYSCFLEKKRSRNKKNILKYIKIKVFQRKNKKAEEKLSRGLNLIRLRTGRPNKKDKKLDKFSHQRAPGSCFFCFSFESSLCLLHKY